MKNASIFTALMLFVVIAISSVAAQNTQSDHSRSGGDKPKKVTIAGDETTIPMDLVGRKPVVDVKINGKGPFKFFLDTGPVPRFSIKSWPMNCNSRPTEIQRSATRLIHRALRRFETRSAALRSVERYLVT